MTRGRSRRADQGLTLIEMMIVVLIVAIVLLIGIPAFEGYRDGAQDKSTQATLSNGAKVAAGLSTQYVGYSVPGYATFADALEATEPFLDFTGATDGDIHVAVGDVSAGDNGQALFYAKSESGTWFGIRLVDWGSSAGRYFCKGPAVGDVNVLANCTGTSW